MGLDLPLPASGEVEPALAHAEPTEPEPAVSLDLPLPVGAEVEPMLEHAEPAVPKPAVSPDLPLPVGAEVEPMLEHAEAAVPEAAVSPDLPLPVGAEVEPMLEHAEAAVPEPAVSPELPLAVGAEVEPMLEHAEAAAPEPAVSPELPLPVGAEVEPMLEHAEAAAPEAAVSPELPLAVGGEVEPMLEHAEAAAPEAAVSPDLPLPVGAEVEPMLEHAEAAVPEAAVSPDLPLPVGAEVEPILEHAEPPEASGNVYTAQKDYDGATAKYSDAIKLEPKFPVAYENRSHITDKAGEGSIGVTIRRVTDGAAHALNVKPACGALVVDMDENGPAKAAGIEPRDVIVKVDGRDVKEWRDLPRIVANVSIGKEIAVTIVRNGKELTKTVKVGRLEYADEQASLTSHKGRPLQEQPVAVDPKSETAGKHLRPGMVIAENQQPSDSSGRLLLVIPSAPPRFGKRPIDHFVSH